MKYFLISILLLNVFSVSGQYDPAAGKPGSKAVSRDSSIFFAWADSCQVIRGLQNALDSSGDLASHGQEQDAVGKSNGNVVSLGDGGVATLKFNVPVVDGPGADFAVFENAFTDEFLELAFVEVSSDGQRFVRFPAISLTDTSVQKGSFDPLDPAKLYNFAGKHRLFYGTPFDLSELADSSGVDLNQITHIRLMDVVGSLNDKLARYDSRGVKVNDPFPTDFISSGFDLDGVGIIHNQQSITFINEIPAEKSWTVYPNPGRAGEQIFIKNPEEIESLSISTINGVMVRNLEAEEWKTGIRIEQQGFYLMKIKMKDGTTGISKLIINE